MEFGCKYGSLNNIEGVEMVLEEMAKDSEDKCTWNTYASLAPIYMRAGLYGKAELALKCLEEKMGPRKRKACHFLLCLYAGISNHYEVYRVWNALKIALPNFNNKSYFSILQALTKLKGIDGITKIFSEWESRFLTYDMRLANIVISNYLEGNMYEEPCAVFNNATSRFNGWNSDACELFMVYSLKNKKVDLALKHWETTLSEKKDDDDWTWRGELVTAFFDYFKKAKDVEGGEQFCRTLQKFGSVDSNVYSLLLKTYLAVGRTLPDMHERLEKEEIQVSDELEDLLAKICPESSEI